MLVRPSSMLATWAIGTLTSLALAGCDSGGEPFAGAPTDPAAAQGPAPVMVVNTEASPVPTTAVGTTSVAGTVAASQQGAWSVTVANGHDTPLPVTITNGGGGTEPARTPFQKLGVGESEGFTSIAVPAGKRLVVENVSVLWLVPPTFVPIMYMNSSTIGGGTTQTYLQLTKMGASLVGGLETWSTSQQVRAYADASPGFLSFAFEHAGDGNGLSTGGTLNVSVTGYLIDL